MTCPKQTARISGGSLLVSAVAAGCFAVDGPDPSESLEGVINARGADPGRGKTGDQTPQMRSYREMQGVWPFQV